MIVRHGRLLLVSSVMPSVSGRASYPIKIRRQINKWKTESRSTPKTGNALYIHAFLCRPKCRFEHENGWKSQYKYMNREIRLSVWLQKTKKLWKQRSAPNNHHNMEFTTAQYKKNGDDYNLLYLYSSLWKPRIWHMEYFWSYQNGKNKLRPLNFYTLKMIYQFQNVLRSCVCKFPSTQTLFKRKEKTKTQHFFFAQTFRIMMTAHNELDYRFSVKATD